MTSCHRRCHLTHSDKSSFACRQRSCCVSCVWHELCTWRTCDECFVWLVWYLLLHTGRHMFAHATAGLTQIYVYGLHHTMYETNCQPIPPAFEFQSPSLQRNPCVSRVAVHSARVIPRTAGETLVFIVLATWYSSLREGATSNTCKKSGTQRMSFCGTFRQGQALAMWGREAVRGLGFGKWA